VIPALLAGLARVGAGLAARVGATSVARSLVGMSRVAGKSVTQRAASRAAASSAAARGTSAATTAAAAPNPAAGIHIRPGNAAPPGLGQPAGTAAGGGGFRVLENTQLSNARAMFQAIYGQTPTAGATTASTATSAAQSTAAAQAAQAASVTPPAAPASVPAPAALPPMPRPMPHHVPPSPASTPASNPRPQSLLDRALDAFDRAKQTAQSMRERFEPVAERVKNMSIDERYGRLQSSGRLLDAGQVGRTLGTPSPSREQLVGASEDAEEQERQKSIQQNRAAQVGQAAWSAGKKALSGAIGAATSPVGALTMPAWMYGVVTGFERLGRTISDTNRDLARFDERIADSMARLDFGQLRSRQQLARATGGSASVLNDQLGALVREMQPMRETVTTFINSAGASLIFLARVGSFIIKWHPLFVAMHKTAQLAERVMGAQQAQEPQAAAKQFLRDIRDGKFNRPRNPRPGRP
jgi:hypothetical protein